MKAPLRASLIEDATTMILIRCPYCHEQRTEEELTYGGEADIARAAEPESVSDQQWAEYLFMRSNPKGLLAEQWCCAFGCGQWFKVHRDLVTHQIHRVLRFDEPDAGAARDARPGGRTCAAHERD
jgi:sarcosine oxidase, subunit delta